MVLWLKFILVKKINLKKLLLGGKILLEYATFMIAEARKRRIERIFELEDISYLNRVSRHIKHSELTENSLNDRVFYKEESLEETVSRCIEYELLHKAISKLPETQRRRLLLYFFGELSYEQIAKLEGCTKMAVKGSVDIALKKLKKLFEKF